MIKILVLVGGVWFSLALLFIGALFAAHSKAHPKNGSKRVSKSQPRAGTLAMRAVSQKASEELSWEMEKPVEA
jgi:hypothetical protein